MHAEMIAQRSINADAPWGRTSVTWRDVSCVRLTYEHCAELSDESMRDDPLLFPYACSTFEAQVPGSGSCHAHDIRRVYSERYAVSVRSAPPPYSPDAELERACREDIASWLSQWIEDHPADWAHGQAIAAHNAYVLGYRSMGNDEDARRSLGPLIQLICPAVPWFFSRGDTALRTWALLHYVRHYARAANAEDALRRQREVTRSDDDS